MTRQRRYLPLCIVALVCAAAGLRVPPTALAADAKPDELLTEEEKKKREEEKAKQPKLKFSAWCAFRDLSDTRPAPKEDITKDETRLAARNWTGFARRGQWAHIILEVQNTTEKDDFTGMASVEFDSVKENERGVTVYRNFYRQEFEVGPLTVKQYGFSVVCPEDGWNKDVMINVSANGRPRGTRIVQLHDLDAFKQDFVIVVSESAGSFRYLAFRKKPGEFEVTGRERIVAVVEPQELPSRWHDLMLANLIIIDGPPREQLTEAQWEALQSYAQAGGHVLIIAGRDPSRLKRDPTGLRKGSVEELAGIEVRGISEVDKLSGGDSDDLNLIPPKDKAWKLPIMDVTVSPKGSPYVRLNKETKQVEMCRRFYGPGSVTFLPFSLSDARLEHWPGRALIPLNILDFAHGRRLFANTTADDDFAPPVQPQRGGWGPAYPQANNRGNAMARFRNTLDNSFINDTPVAPQPKSRVMAFMLLYLMCVVPGNYLLFGWLRRREIAWLAVPLWAAAFGVMAYAVGYMGQTGQLTVNEVAVVEAGAGQGVGMARTFIGIYAPRRDDYWVEFPPLRLPGDNLFDVQGAPNHLVNLTRSESRGIDTEPLYLMDTSQGLLIERLLIQTRSTRCLEVVHRALIGDGLDVSVREARNAPSDSKTLFDIEVQNNTGYGLYFPVFIYEGKALQLGTTADNALPAGASRKLTGAEPAKGMNPQEAFFGKTIVLPSARGPHTRNRSNALNEYVRQQVDKYPHGVVCAWMDNAKGTLPVRIGAGGYESKEPKIEGLSLLLVPVIVKSTSAAGATPTSFRLRQSSDYNINVDQGQWNAVTGNVAFRRDHSVGPNGAVTHLRAELPPNYRVLSFSGLQVQLRFALDVQLPAPPARPRQGTQAQPQFIDGDVRIEVKQLLEDGRNVWTPVGAPALVTNLQPGKPYKLPTLALPWSSVSGNIILMRISFIPNAARNPGNYTLQMQAPECKTGRP